MLKTYEVVEACRIPPHGWVQPGRRLELTPSQARYPELEGKIRVPKPKKAPAKRARAAAKG
ncbi:MAG: hypothetical protein F4X56_00730 [Gammaproteobacteria bacterium]|nr:hypothetical protein [Gammaproteobacteria bacterium]